MPLKSTTISCKIIFPISVPISSNNYSFYLDFNLLPLYALLKVDFQVGGVGGIHRFLEIRG